MCMDISFNWHCSKDFNFLVNDFMINSDKSASRNVDIFINQESHNEEDVEKIYRNSPRFSIGVNGIFNGVYISSYFCGKIFIITNKEKGYTSAKIDKEFAGDEKKLFLGSLIQSHIIRHLLYEGYFVFHAAAIIEKETEKSILILGKSGMGKTTFAMEAVKSGKYRLISEDKVIMNPQNKKLYGSQIAHLRKDAKDKYRRWIMDLSVINGGTEHRKYQAVLQPEFYSFNGILDRVIILNQKYSDCKSFCRLIMNSKEVKDNIILSQENMYLDNEMGLFERACKELMKYPILELYHTERDLNFEVFHNLDKYEEKYNQRYNEMRKRE